MAVAIVMISVWPVGLLRQIKINNNKFIERHFPMVQWRFTALTKKIKKIKNKKKLKHSKTGQQFT